MIHNPHHPGTGRQLTVVLGMMPHPENHVEPSMGCADGRGLFAGLVDYLERAA